MSDDMREINESIKKLHNSLLHQLKHTNIEYIDLLQYYNTLETLKTHKRVLYRDEMMRDDED